MKKILFLFIFSLFIFSQSLLAIDIELDGEIERIAGTECQTATYRLGTEASYGGEDIDLIVEVIQEDNEYGYYNNRHDYYNANCVDISNNVLSFHIRDRDYSQTVASMDIKVTVVKEGTMTPIVVDNLNITNFDLDSNSDLTQTQTDDVYYQNPSKVYLSEYTNVTKSTGSFFNQYNTKLKGQSTGNCDDSATLVTKECRAGVVYNNTSSFYARVQNDNAYSSSRTDSAHRLIQFSFEVKDLTPLIPDKIEKSCGTYYFSNQANSWYEGNTPSTYNNSIDINQALSIENATQIRVTVTGQTESGYDYVSIYDKDDTQQYKDSGTLNSNSFLVEGNSVRFRLQSDYSQQYLGATVKLEGLGCNPPTISISQNKSITEGNSGTQEINLTISLDKPAPQGGITLEVVPHDITANEGEDYTRKTSSIFIPVNETEATITYLINGDRDVEIDETFKVEILANDDVILGESNATVTIINDDKNSLDLDQDNDGILDSIEYGSCSDGVNTLMSFDDFGQGGRTTTPFTTYCYEDGTGGDGSCQAQKHITYWAGNTNVNDGEYAIVQHPNPDASVFSTWSKQGDHTGNENGRMMVVNASLEPDEFYRRTYDIVPYANMTVDLWILNVVKEGSNLILPNISFKLEDIDGKQIGEMVNTGDIPENGIWNHYTLSLNPENHTKIQVVLANNAPGGNGNDLALDDIRVQQVFCDHDNDTIADYLDLDSDNDGIPDNIEAQKSQEYIVPNNEFNSKGLDTAYLNGLTPVDTDEDNISDFLDLDSDNDGLFDIVESGLGNNDTDNDGRTNHAVGVNGLDNSASIESSDDYSDVNGMAHDETVFKLKESDDDTNDNGQNAHPMRTDFDYRDNLPIATLSIADTKILEGDSGEKVLTFTVLFDHPTDRIVTFKYKTVDGTAKASDNDYETIDSNITLNVFTTKYTISVPIKGDTNVEEDETFTIELSEINGVVVSNSTATGTILNDDSPQLKIERINSDKATIGSEERKSFYTQIAGKDFDYSIVSYNGNSLYSIKDITVKVELFDKNSSKNNDIIFNQYLHLGENNRFNIEDNNDLKVARATRDAIFKISYLLDENGTLVHGDYSNEVDYNNTKNMKDKNGTTINSEMVYYSDDFAIRPATYIIELNDLDENNQTVTYKTNNNDPSSVNLAAGYNYKLEAHAVIDENNSIAENYKTISSKELNVTLDFDETGTTHCADTNTSNIKNYNFVNGQFNGNFSHNNVGKYILHIEDINWTSIDKDEENLGCVLNSSSNIADATGKFGCNIASDEGADFDDIRVNFQPYKFVFSNTQLTNINGNGKDYTYMSDLTLSQAMGLNLHSTIEAKGKNGTTLTNFTNGCMATEVKLSTEFTVLSDSGEHNSSENFVLLSTKESVVHPQNILRVNDDNSTNLAPFNNLTLSKESFLNENEGNISIDILYNMQKNFNDTTNPISVNFRTLDINSTDIKTLVKNKEISPKGEADINSRRTFYFARVASSLENFPETNKAIIKTPLYVEIYCKVPGNRAWCDNNMKLNTIGRNNYKTDKGWYLAVEHNSTIDGQVTNLENIDTLSSVTTTLDAPTTVPDFVEGRITNVETKYDETMVGETKATIAIKSDPWLRFNTKNISGMPDGTSSYTVTFKGISGLTGVSTSTSKGNTGLGRNLMQDGNGSIQGIIEHNGKLSW